MTNLERQFNLAAAFVEQTWRSVVRGDMTAPPGAPKLKFDRLSQRTAYADSIISTRSLNMPESGRLIHEIIATNQMGVKTERGYPAYDMKPMLLNGPKARISKKGKKYNIIPFRHGAGENTQHFKPMPSDIHDAAKELRATTNVMGRRIQGDRLTGTEKRYPALVHQFTKPSGEVGRYQRKNGHYEGMIRVEAKYGQTVQSKYLTMRVVSENSDPDAWWHPGRQAQPHIEWVKRYCEPKINKLLLDAAKLDLVDVENVSIGFQVRGM